MRTGDLVRARGYKRLWVVLPVSRNQAKRLMNARGPGTYLFGGLWYGRDPLSHRSYGKMIGGFGRTVGTLESPRLRRQLGSKNLYQRKIKKRMGW